MDDLDPLVVGLKVGLEIHQQLGTQGSRKLFCGCPAEIVDHQPDLIVRRQLRAAAGETGEVDVAAAAEQAKAKRFAYGAHRQYTCLVELDEEPPHPCDQEALDTVLMIAKACNAHLLPKVQFMRKTIVDGSNVSGFQRTGLVALGGTVPGTPVRVQTIALEEDAAKIISRTAHEDTYDLSRLGIPLIELATEPDIGTPEQAREVAAHIGMLLRSTRRVKRGLGTIRQDLNVSIAGGARIEIKGCQDLRQIPLIVRNEMRRQRELISLAAALNGQTLTVHEPVDVTELFAGSSAPFIKKAIMGGARAVGVRIERLDGVLGKELLPNRRVGSELADIARSQGFGGLIHSDEDLAKYGADSMALRERFACASRDAFIVLIGEPHRIGSTLSLSIAARIAQLPFGVPKEVRKAETDATTSFLRPMPSGARMYPETDIPIVRIDASNVPPIKLLSEQVSELAKELGVSRDVATSIFEQEIPFKEIQAQHPMFPVSFLASTVVDWPKEVETKFNVHFAASAANTTISEAGTQIPYPAHSYVTPLLPKIEEGLYAGSVVKSVLYEVGDAYSHGRTISPHQVLEIAGKYQTISESEIRAHVQQIIRSHPGATSGGMMGLVMSELRGKVDGKELDRILREELARTL